MTLSTLRKQLAFVYGPDTEVMRALIEAERLADHAAPPADWTENGPCADAFCVAAGDPLAWVNPDRQAERDAFMLLWRAR